MSRLANLQRRRNQESQDDASWTCAASHRRRVTELLAHLPTQDPARLLLLGAGNCHDVDLQQLVKVFNDVHLVDLDVESLEYGVSKQQLEASPCLTLHGGCDVTGMFSELARWPDQLASGLGDEHEAEGLVHRAAGFAGLDLPTPFDVVASLCLLSQIIDAAATSLSQRHPHLIHLIRSLRERHIRLLVELTRPGGSGLLITDFVSSDTAVGLERIPAAQLPLALRGMIEARNFFTGLNPAVIAAQFQRDAVIADQITNLRCLDPWIWNHGARYYAVAGFAFRRVD